MAGFLRKIGEALHRSLRSADPLLNDEIDHLEKYKDAVVVILKIHFERMHCVIACDANHIKGLLDMWIKPLSNQQLNIRINMLTSPPNML